MLFIARLSHVFASKLNNLKRSKTITGFLRFGISVLIFPLENELKRC